MNDTRKEIISIISDCMDKTLSEGCLMKSTSSCITKYCLFKGYDRTSAQGKEGHIFFKYIGDGDLIEDFEKTNGDSNFLEILGHYDITAVLKYIYDKGYYASIWSKNIIEFADKVECEESEAFETHFSIKNKPLHLYSEQEEKDLLELLCEE